MNDNKIKEFVKALLTDRKETVILLENAKETLVGGESQNSEDFAQMQTDKITAEAQMNRLTTKLALIDKALATINEDPEEFFTCEDCGDDIGVERLKTLLTTRVCVSCKEMEEEHSRMYAK